LTSTVYKATDSGGNPLPGVHITQVSDAKNYGCGAQTNDGFTGSDGTANIDTGCWLGSTGTYTADLPGYQTATGRWASGLSGTPPTQITMRQVATSFNGSCLPGFVYDSKSDQCIQTSSANWLNIIGDTVKANWLLIVVLAAVAVLLFALLYRPKSLSSAVGAVAGGTS